MVDLKVNKKLLPIKAHYFLFNAGKILFNYISNA